MLATLTKVDNSTHAMASSALEARDAGLARRGIAADLGDAAQRLAANYREASQSGAGVD